MRFSSIAIALVFLAIASSATGQAFGNKIKRIDLGMSRIEVIEILGKPDGVRTHENVVALTYADRLMSGVKWTRADYVVILTDDKVTEYGLGEIRTNNPNTGAFVFIPL